MSLVAVTIARNEEALIETTILSVLNQTVKPDMYVIVDDGSTDRTPEIIKKYYDQGVFYVKVKDARYEVRSYNLCRAVNLGFKVSTFICPAWEFALKIDSDSSIPENYLEEMLSFMKHPRLGIVSGCMAHRKLWKNRPSDGAKVYRRECWDEIGGMDYVTGWDTHGIIKANQMNWTTLNVPIIYTEARTSKRQRLREWYQTGATRYFLGFPLWHTAGVSIVYMNDPPYGLGAMVMLLTHIVFRIINRGRIFNEEYYAYAKKFAFWEMTERVRTLINYKIIK